MPVSLRHVAPSVVDRARADGAVLTALLSLLPIDELPIPIDPDLRSDPPRYEAWKQRARARAAQSWAVLEAAAVTADDVGPLLVVDDDAVSQRFITAGAEVGVDRAGRPVRALSVEDAAKNAAETSEERLRAHYARAVRARHLMLIWID